MYDAWYRWRILGYPFPAWVLEDPEAEVAFERCEAGYHATGKQGKET